MILVKRSGAFVIDYLVALTPLWLISPFVFLYMFSDSGVNQLVSWTALITMIVLSPIFYILVQFAFSLSGPDKNTLGRKIMKIEIKDTTVENKPGFVKTLFRMSPIIFIVPAVLLSAWPLLLVYPAVALWRTDNKSLSDLISGTQTIDTASEVANS